MSDTALRRPILPALAITGVLFIAGCGTQSVVPRGPGIDGRDVVAATRLIPLPNADKAGALAEISGLQTKGRGPKTGYSRDRFGEAWTDDAEGVLWAGNGCSTRDDILNRDLDQVQKRDRCVVIGGQFTDPYTNEAETFSKSQASDYPIDHVVPLSYSWQMGAARWLAEKRVQLRQRSTESDSDNAVGQLREGRLRSCLLLTSEQGHPLRVCPAVLAGSDEIPTGRDLCRQGHDGASM